MPYILFTIHKNTSTKFNKPVQNDDSSISNDEISIFQKSGKTKYGAKGIRLPHDEFKKASLCVLQKYEEVSSFMEEYTRDIESQNPVRNEIQNIDFLDWFRARISILFAKGSANNELISLAASPYPLVHRYSTYMVNGFRFYRKVLDLRRKTQNSGVLVRGDDSDSNKEYYGLLEDIYELSYVENRKVYLFKCRWWDVAHLERGYKIDKYGFTSVNTRCALNTKEPFVLASQAEQVFYLNDMVDKDWLIVIKTNPRDLFNMLDHDDNFVEAEDEILLDREAYQ